jgi:hypothetical protein
MRDEPDEVRFIAPPSLIQSSFFVTPVVQLFMSHSSPALAAMQLALAEGKAVYVHCAQVPPHEMVSLIYLKRVLCNVFS